MKAFDKWYDGQASLDLDYRTARSLWHAARKGPKRKLRELREQQSQDESKLARSLGV